MSLMTEVHFHDDVLHAFRDGRGVWVGIRRVCRFLGLDFGRELMRLTDGRCPWAMVVPAPGTGRGRRQRNSVMINLDALPMWLATIDAGRVAVHLRPKLGRYQRECAAALRDHFARTPAANPPAVADDPQAPVLAAVCDFVRLAERTLGDRDGRLAARDLLLIQDVLRASLRWARDSAARLVAARCPGPADGQRSPTRSRFRSDEDGLYVASGKPGKGGRR